MYTRRLGPFSVSALGFGCMSLSHAYGTPPPPEDATPVLLKALDLGYTHLDSAALYGFGANETLLGRVLKHRWHEAVVATKGGMFRNEQGQREVDGRPEVIVQNCDESLSRLGIETIDLYYLHRRDRKVPIEDSVGALAGLVKAGKVKTIGLSEVSAATIRAAHAVHPISAVQTEYSLWTRNPEVAVLETCRELGITVVAFSPLARGFLTGRLRGISHLPPKDIRHNMPRFQPEHLPHNLSLLDGLSVIAGQHQCTMGQVALAWVLARGDHIIPIPGTTNLEHLAENAGAVDVHLSGDTMRALDALINPGTVSGPRYSDAVQKDIDTEELPPGLVDRRPKTEDRRPKTNDRIEEVGMRICLAGTGAMGEIHVKALAKIEGVEVVSVASRGEESGKAFAEKFNIPFASTNLEACIDRPGVDAVILTTPSDQHHDQTVMALQKGKHVQVEIPMALNLKDARNMLAASQKAGKVCMVTHTRRFSSPHREIRRRIQDGTFHLHHMVVETYFFRRTNLNMHGQPRSWVDNLLWHHGCHSVDLAQWVVGDADWECWGQKGPNHQELGIPMDLTVAMKSSKGPLFSMAMSFNNKGPFGGFYRYIGEEDTYKVYRDGMTDSEGKDVPLDSMTAFDRQDVEFVGAIREGREPESSAASCVKTMALLDKIDRAMGGC